MKNYKILSFLFLLTLFVGCKEDVLKNQEENEMLTPRILGGDIAAIFPNPNAVQVLEPGEEVDFSSLQFSPAGKVDVLWKVDGEQVAVGEQFVYKASGVGDHRVSVEASYNGTTVSRYKDVFVLAESGEAFTPKQYNRVVLSYLGETGDIARLDWDQVSHVCFKAGLVNTSGVLDLSRGDNGRKSQEIVTKAHLKGVSVLLGISGALSANGWNVYDASPFGNALKDVAKRSEMVKAIKAYVELRNFDGVDIMMADIGNSVEATTTANIAATISFVNELRVALGTSKTISLTVPVNYTHSYYTASNLANVNWVHVRAFESGANTGTGRPLGNPSGYDYMVSSANIWKGKLPLSKLVIGIPAMGLRYTAVDANGNNLSFTSFNYIPFRDILALHPTAFDKEKVDLSPAPLAIYFNGVPMVTRKANFIKDSGFLGAYLWQGDFDVSGPNSLTKAIYDVLK